MRKTSLLKTIAILFFSFCQFKSLFAQQVIDTTKIYGVTVEYIDGINDIRTALAAHCRKMTLRIAFDKSLNAGDYIDTVDSLNDVAFIMGEPIDSYYDSSFTVAGYLDRTTEFLNQFYNEVDIWEIGNEVNGEWCGPIDSVVAKISGAYNIVKPTGKKTALTLFYNRDCWSDPQNEMFTWTNANIPTNMKQGLDYVLVSYYDDDCNSFQPDFQQLFDSLHVMFPNSKLGMGECGTMVTANKAAYMHRYYEMNITTPGFIGGDFWWFYRDDCVPKTLSLWDTLNSILCVPTAINDINAKQENMSIYPNPTNGKFQIKMSGQQLGKNFSSEIYNMQGQKIYQLNIKNAESEIDLGSLSKGIYFIKVQSTESEKESKIYTEKIIVE